MITTHPFDPTKYVDSILEGPWRQVNYEDPSTSGTVSAIPIPGYTGLHMAILSIWGYATFNDDAPVPLVVEVLRGANSFIKGPILPQDYKGTDVGSKEVYYSSKITIPIILSGSEPDWTVSIDSGNTTDEVNMIVSVSFGHFGG
jgi:hypothetical protein